MNDEIISEQYYIMYNHMYVSNIILDVDSAYNEFISHVEFKIYKEYCDTYDEINCNNIMLKLSNIGFDRDLMIKVKRNYDNK